MQLLIQYSELVKELVAMYEEPTMQIDLSQAISKSMELPEVGTTPDFGKDDETWRYSQIGCGSLSLAGLIVSLVLYTNLPPGVQDPLARSADNLLYNDKIQNENEEIAKKFETYGIRLDLDGNHKLGGIGPADAQVIISEILNGLKISPATLQSLGVDELIIGRCYADKKHIPQEIYFDPSVIEIGPFCRTLISDDEATNTALHQAIDQVFNIIEWRLKENGEMDHFIKEWGKLSHNPENISEKEIRADMLNKFSAFVVRGVPEKPFIEAELNILNDMINQAFLSERDLGDLTTGSLHPGDATNPFTGGERWNVSDKFGRSSKAPGINRHKL
ncbi:hypothetical protein GF389_04355 [Candidatus Dojkabacteria bacterium]|nr:hypothetical protein [Candidatus Dojkabacteria bacterium]